MLDFHIDNSSIAILSQSNDSRMSATVYNSNQPVNCGKCPYSRSRKKQSYGGRGLQQERMPDQPNKTCNREYRVGQVENSPLIPP